MSILIFFQAYGLYYPTGITVALIIVAFIICHGFLTTFDMTLNTIFICFCEDCEINDGITRPYSMSMNLQQVMMEVKAKEEAKESGETDDMNYARLS
jgi:hypothetical protein